MKKTLSRSTAREEKEEPEQSSAPDEIFCNSIDYILGRGVHGLVLLGFHPRSRNKLAIKCLLPEKSGRVTDIARSRSVEHGQCIQYAKLVTDVKAKV